MNEYKKTNPGLKTILAIGGVNLFIEDITYMLSYYKRRRRFIYSTIAYLRKYNFDGVSLDFIGLGQMNSPATNKAFFTDLCKVNITFDSSTHKLYMVQLSHACIRTVGAHARQF